MVLSTVVYTQAFAQYLGVQNYNIPSWIKNTAKWWGEGQISDSDFIASIKYLIENKILQITDVDNQESEEYQELNQQLESYKKQTKRLEAENNALKRTNVFLKSQIDTYEYQLSIYEDDVRQSKELIEQYQDYANELQEWAKKYETSQQTGPPVTTIKDETVHWEFSDSKGNRYGWQMPITTYEYLLQNKPYEYVLLELPDEQTVRVVDLTKFVGKSFENVIDEIYDNSQSDGDFLYEVWYLVSQMTIYSTELEETPRYALETFSRGAGDCEDTAILIADMLRSSKYARDWKIQLVYFDSDNPTEPQGVNHVAIYVDTGNMATFIESTAKTVEAANAWNDKRVFGWWYDV